jgi:hypothetical protein
MLVVVRAWMFRHPFVVPGLPTLRGRGGIEAVQTLPISRLWVLVVLVLRQTLTTLGREGRLHVDLERCRYVVLALRDRERCALKRDGMRSGVPPRTNTCAIATSAVVLALRGTPDRIARPAIGADQRQDRLRVIKVFLPRQRADTALVVLSERVSDLLA